VADINVRELAGQKVDYTQVMQADLAENDLFVVTLMDEFDRQPELQGYLRANYPVLKETPEMIIFDLQGRTYSK
jgi:hypothetical protein